MKNICLSSQPLWVQKSLLPITPAKFLLNLPKMVSAASQSFLFPEWRCADPRLVYVTSSGYSQISSFSQSGDVLPRAGLCNPFGIIPKFILHTCEVVKAAISELHYFRPAGFKNLRLKAELQTLQGCPTRYVHSCK